MLGVIRKSSVEPFRSVKLIRTPKYPVSFSFFTFVFVHPSINDNEAIEIVNHEREHIRQRHWIDLALFEVLCVLQWFNPACWLYGRFIRQNHEYLADERALQHSASPALYRAALLKQMFGGPVIAMAHSFNYSLNTKRFNMMKNKMYSPMRKLKLLLALPLMAIVFYAFATPEYVFTELIAEGSLAAINPQEKEKAANDTSEVTIKFTPTGNASKTAPVVAEDKDQGDKKSRTGLKKETISFQSPNDHPLYVVDGVIRENGNIDDLAAGDIHSMNVLKGEKAIEKYGNKGKNGVVVVVGYGIQKNEMKLDTSAFKHRYIKMSDNGVITYETKTDSSGQKQQVRIHAIGEKPLVIVNGEVQKSQKINDIDPSTIQSISILKDESATVIYGDKGKNGVVIVTLKGSKSSGISTNSGKYMLSSSGSSSGNSNGTGHSYSVISGSAGPDPAVWIAKDSSSWINSAAIVNSNSNSNNNADLNFNGKHPLLILNGKIAENQDIGGIPAEDIISVSIYKKGQVVEKYGEKAKDGVVEVKTKKKYQYLKSRTVSNIATMFSGGTSERILWTVLKMKPPPGEKSSRFSLTWIFTSAGVARFSTLWVLMPPPQKVRSFPNSSFNLLGSMLMALICTGFSISKPASIRSGINS